MKIVVLDDGNRGHLNQILGILAFIPDASVETHAIVFRGPTYRLPGRRDRHAWASRLVAAFCAVRAWSLAERLFRATGSPVSLLEGGVADVVISAGSLTAPVALVAARRRKARPVVLMVPSLLPLSLFHRVIIPLHDKVRLAGEPRNLIVTLGAPNPVRDEVLLRAGERLRGLLKEPPERRFAVGVIIGGDDQNFVVTRSWAERLLAALRSLDSPYRFFLTTSKRTAPGVAGFILRDTEGDSRFVYREFPGISRDSHYYGMMEMSGVLLVTEDSVNMISEAATSGRPVVILGISRRRDRRLVYDRTREELVIRGYAEYLPADRLGELAAVIRLAAQHRGAALNEAKICARLLCESIRLKRS